MSSSVGGSGSSVSTPFGPHQRRAVVLRNGLTPTHASGTAIRSSLSSAFVPGTAIGYPSYPSSASEQHLQVRLMVESILDSCTIGLKNMTARHNIQIRKGWEEEL